MESAERAAIVLDPEPRTHAGTQLSGLARPACDQERVLVVDDDPQILHGVGRFLTDAGYVVVSASRLDLAMQTLCQGDFALVITDLYLGDGLGYRIADAARQCKPPVPTIVLTGRPSLAGAQEAIRAHVSDFVIKPIDPHSLVQTCRRAIRESVLTQQKHWLEAQNKVLAGVLPRAIEAKDPTTSGHAERVVTYTDNLALRCGVGDDERSDLRMASLLHDVGKIGIPERILTKQGPLDPDERMEIQRHPEMGRVILEPLVDGERIRRWVYQHHERWDGKGYPNRLQGDEVELPGRILILAEVYDALAEERSYKAAWPTDRIVALFREQAGQHFDPDLAHLVADGLCAMDKGFFTTPP